MVLFALVEHFDINQEMNGVLYSLVDMYCRFSFLMYLCIVVVKPVVK